MMKKTYIALTAVAIGLCGCVLGAKWMTDAPAPNPTLKDGAFGQAEALGNPAETTGDNLVPEETKEASMSLDIQWAQDDLYAVAYVGYRGITEWEQDLNDYTDALGIVDALTHYEMGGDECFLVIPRNPESAVALYALDINDAGDDVVGEARYTQPNGNPFVVFCNQSDIFSNVEIQISYADETIRFSPQISLRDGYMAQMARGQDLTQYDTPREVERLPLAQSTEFYFSSGAGAWGTVLTLDEEGGFVGEFGDSDGSIHYYSKFSGAFTDCYPLTYYSYALTLEDVQSEDEVGQEHQQDGITYIASEPYGLESGWEFVFYGCNTPVEELPQGLRDWCHYDLESREYLGCYAIYNVSEELAFFSEEFLK